MVETPSNAEINGMNKDQLKKCLKSLIKDLNEEHVAGPSHPLVDEDTATVTQLLTSVLEEVKELRKERSNLASELQKLKEENSFLIETVGQHQRFLEALDGEKRSQNLIITGVREDIPLVESNEPEQSATTDTEKVSLVLKQIGHKDDVTIKEVFRLGKKKNGTGTRPRPLKIITNHPQERKRVIDDARKLKEAGENFKKIYIKKDTHPVVRKELNRIRQAERDEKRKPENEGREVKYDNETSSRWHHY